VVELDIHTERLIAALKKQAELAAPVTEADWERLTALAIQHHVEPVLYAWLKERTILPPQSVVEQLREIYLASAARNMGLFHELGKILHAFQAAGIPVIPLKGACLAERVYGDIALRPMADIDLLVRPGDLVQSVSMLRALGYDSDQPFDPIAAKTGFQDMPPLSKPGSFPVEVHWTLVTPLCNANLHEDELEKLWSRATPGTIAGVEALLLSPTDLLLHLCMHMSVHHRFNGISLRNIIDVAEVCRHYESELNWTDFAARADRWEVAGGVHIALQLATEWTDCAVSSDALAGLAGAPADDAMMGWVKHKVLNGTPATLNSQVARLEGSTGAAGKLGAIRDAILLPRAVMARIYPAPADSWRIMTYYPIRLKDLFVRYHRVLWKLATRDTEFVADAQNEARLREYLGWS